jgi:hypothetical protein
LQTEFPNLGDLGSQEPMPIIVVSELWWNLDSASDSIFLHFLQGPRPQIRIGGAHPCKTGEVIGLKKGQTF